MLREKIIRTASLGAAAITLGVSAAVVPGQPVAAAPACNSQPVANRDNGWVHTTVDNAPLRRAPYGHCGVVTRLNQGTRIWIWCGAANVYDNLWLWGRVDGTQTYGWISFSNVSQDPTDGGFALCPGE